MPLFQSIRWPWVSRARYEDAHGDYKRTNEEAIGYLQKIDELEARIAELEAPEAAVKRDIAVAEGKIALAELEIKLRRLKEDPDPEDAKPAHPSIERVMEVAAANRRAKNLKLVNR